MSATTQTSRPIGRFRHWKQRFDKNAAFIVRRPFRWRGTLLQRGSPIPEELQKMPTKLRRFWEAQSIELAEFPPGQKPGGDSQLPAGVRVKSLKGPWFLVVSPLGETKVMGKKKLAKKLAELTELSTERPVVVDPPLDGVVVTQPPWEKELFRIQTVSDDLIVSREKLDEILREIYLEQEED